MKSAIEKAQSARKFVSPSYASDIKKKLTNEKSKFELSDAATLAMSLWPLRRYPKLTMVGLIAAGIYIGYSRNKAKKRAQMI